MKYSKPREDNFECQGCPDGQRRGARVRVGGPGIRRHAWAGALGVTIALVAAACGSSGTTGAGPSASDGGSTTNTANAPSGKPIIIGAIAATTGSYAVVGNEMFDAETLAVAKLNASGGILGRPVKLVTHNDGASATVSAQAYKELISGGAVAITGSPATGPTTAALAEKYHIVDIGDIDDGALTIYPNGLSKPPRAWDFDTATNSAAYGALDAQYALKHCKGLAVLHDPTAYGVGGNEAITSTMQQAGKKPVLDEAISEDWSSGATVPITSEINKIVGAGADCVVAWLSPNDQANFVKTAQGLGQHLTVLGNDSTNLGTTFTSLAGSAGAGVITGQLRAVVHPNARVAAFNKDYQAKYNSVPGVFSYGGYDAIMILAKAINNAGSTNENAIRQALNQIKGFPGLTGTLSFSPSAHQTMTTSQLQLVKWDPNSNKWIPIS